MVQRVIKVEQNLAWTNKADMLAWRLNKLVEGNQVTITFEGGRWLAPIDLVLLVLAIRIVYEKTKIKVRLDKIAPNVDSYLKLMSTYDLIDDICILPEESKGFKLFSKSSIPSNKYVVLTEMKELVDIEQFIIHLNEVLLRNYPGDEMAMYRGKVSTVVLEACSNGVEHSQGQTYGVVQTYDYENAQRLVHIAIGDNGIGIPAHLSQRYPHLGDADYIFIKRALDGFSGRKGKRGGNGLRRIREICNEQSGLFSIRSGWMTLAVLPEERKRTNNAIFPGTQLNIVLYPHK
jgi:hypothetical protein